MVAARRNCSWFLEIVLFSRYKDSTMAMLKTLLPRTASRPYEQVIRSCSHEGCVIASVKIEVLWNLYPINLSNIPRSGTPPNSRLQQAILRGKSAGCPRSSGMKTWAHQRAVSSFPCNYAVPIEASTTFAIAVFERCLVLPISLEWMFEFFDNSENLS